MKRHELMSEPQQPIKAGFSFCSGTESIQNGKGFASNAGGDGGTLASVPDGEPKPEPEADDGFSFCSGTESIPDGRGFASDAIGTDGGRLASNKGEPAT